MSRRKDREESKPGGTYDIPLEKVVVTAPGQKPDEVAAKKQIAQKVLSSLPPAVDRGLRVAFGIPVPSSMPLSQKEGASPETKVEIAKIERRALERLQTQQAVDSLK